MTRFVLLTALLVCAPFLETQAQQNAGKTELRGWLSDEGCGGGRARGGLYTGTNPICAKKCVREGQKTVLLDPDKKRVLTIENPDVAMENMGDYVEVSGDLNEQAETLRIDSLKLLEKAVPYAESLPRRMLFRQKRQLAEFSVDRTDASKARRTFLETSMNCVDLKKNRK